MQDNIIEYGEVSGELCTNCHKCSEYDLSLDYKYTKFLFISFYERSKKYFLRCRNCRIYSEISKPKAQYIIDTKFGEFERKRKSKLLIKNALVTLLIGAIIFGVVMGVLYDPEVLYKTLIADKPDGYYQIYDKEGDIWAQITKEGGTARYDMLVRRETIKEEDYNNIKEDLYDVYYLCEQDGKLKYIEDNAGYLEDKNGVGIQYYFYDAEKDEVFYDFGVDDFSKIAYIGKNRAEYPMTYYDEQNKQYLKVYEKYNDREMILMFGDELESIELYTLEGGRTVKYEYYDLLDDNDKAIILPGISRISNFNEVTKALSESGLKPVYTEEDKYYKDTKVVESAETIYQDASGFMRTDYIYYNVEESGGYYIVTEKKNSLPEGQQA